MMMSMRMSQGNRALSGGQPRQQQDARDCTRGTVLRASPSPAPTSAIPKPQLQAEGPSQSKDLLPRRLTLMGLAAMALLPMGQAKAYSYKSELCVMQNSVEDADACRRKLIDKDATKQEDYSAVADRKFSTVSGVPVSVLDSEYTRSSEELMGLIQAYCTLDPYDKERIAVVKKLKLDGIAWVSKYARGGSARSESARKLYIAVDGVIGFLASNGLAPYPKSKVKVTLATVDKAQSFLALGK